MESRDLAFGSASARLSVNTRSDSSERADTTALAAVAGGDRESRSAVALRSARYTEIAESWGRGLARVAAHYSRSASEREDLQQEITLAIWRALPSYRGEASLRTFAYRIAHNCAISHLRRRRRTTTVEAAEAVDTAPSAERVLAREAERQRLLDAIAELPLGARQVLTLHLEGLSYAEIAAVVGITETNVSVRLTRARKALRERLGAPS